MCHLMGETMLLKGEQGRACEAGQNFMVVLPEKGAKQSMLKIQLLHD